MRPTARTFLALSVASLVGCGESTTPLPAPTGGKFALPNNAGSFEIATEAPGAGRGAREKGHKIAIIATFYGPDGRTPMDPAPTDVGVKLGGDGADTVVGLVPSPGPAKSPARFASSPGPYPDAFRGTIVAKIGGESVEAPFNYR